MLYASMLRIFVVTLSGLVGCLSLSAVVSARELDPADYPLRVHIVKNTSQAPQTYLSKNPAYMPDYINGQGAADLFENGQPSGFGFNYSCIQPLRPSGGYATYPGRWKKKERTLEILVPENGKPWNTMTCELQVEMLRGLAFFWNPEDDSVVSETSAAFKDWMVKHKYDPEKDMNDPIEVAPVPAGSGGTGSSSSQHPGSH
jgi:hypothetical protein